MSNQNDNGHLASQLTDAFNAFIAKLEEHNWRVAARIDLDAGYYLSWEKKNERWCLWAVSRGQPPQHTEVKSLNKALRIRVADKLPDLMEAIIAARLYEAHQLQGAIQKVNNTISYLEGSKPVGKDP